MISPYHWIIQFRFDSTNEGKIAQIIYADPNFTNDIQTYENLRKYLRSRDCYYDTSTRQQIRTLFHQYERAIQT